jgi:uncharacterized membrane protein YqjE
MSKEDIGRGGESVQQFVSDVTTLIRHEIALAQSEMSEKIKSAAVGAGMLSAAALAAVMTLVCLTALVAVLLTLVIAPWIAVLLVTLVWGGVALVAGLVGKRKVSDATPFMPDETIEQIKEDAAWARARTKHRA